ncbi:uncharacterized protein LOC133189807 [Saccostrea echinata]|uniref:uncharacterized protein LOC133189807 n=1 Tax=Saccostrea echinata TaxID=191078 RepID=UPI002A7FB829|nr:uncharacterized protein LOC133189807 [Saccostrea echinata]
MAFVDEKIQEYFFNGYDNKEIIFLLWSNYGVKISCRHLKRRMTRLNLRRRRPYNVDMAIRAIQEEMMFSGQTLGCRSMKRRLLQTHGFFIGRDNMLCLLRIIDPDGVDLRASHCLTRRMYLNNGPNYLAHVDGYDKLKPLGFAIHGAMCGYISENNINY